MDREVNVRLGFGGLLIPLLQVALIVLKFTGHITWSWLWVLSPLWGSFVVSIIVLLVVLFVAAFGGDRS